ncbi:MAG: transcriptional regulator [Dactylosporangium sp.]|nr:transcriptional regulator [Dactylosporangium sp.]NNJ60766.1 transcriptional regulator [Dactylosporangium sp.]
MPRSPRTSPSRGAITGYVMKLIRESLPVSQEHLAADLGVDLATVQSWETGRRPFTATAFGRTIAIRNQLAHLGADPPLLATIDDAAHADYLLGQLLDTDPETADLNQHALGWSVLTHQVTDLIHWAAVGKTPAALAPAVAAAPARGRRGPVAAAPTLDPAQRAAFFTNTQVLADRSIGHDDRLATLHRQACFLAGIDPTGASASWLSRITKSTKTLSTFPTWNRRWPAARSVATSLAQQGDPEPLRDFITRAHPDDTCGLAALNYSAYWVGELRHRQHDDAFMTDPRLPWRGTLLLRHLIDRLRPGHPFLDLNIHNLWLLLTARPGILNDDPALSRDLITASQRLLDSGGLWTQSHTELTCVYYGVRMDAPPQSGTR